MLNHKIAKQVFEVTLEYFRDSLANSIPEGAFRDFQLWASSPKNPKQTIWLQILGVPQFAHLTTHLLDGLISDEQWADLLHFTGVMNAYLMYETVSDNIAIGLYYHHADHESITLRLDVMGAFNEAMIGRLEGTAELAHETIGEVKEKAQHISNFKHSLTENEMRSLSKLYLNHDQAHTLDEVEYSIFPALWANMETCANVIEAIENHALAEICQKGLIWRYGSVNRQLKELDDLTVDDMVKIGAHSILVIPVLAYYIAAITEVTNTSHEAWINDLRLEEALYDAALLVRLLNDIGSVLLSDENQRYILIQQLKEEIQHLNGSKPSTFIHLLENLMVSNPVLTRLEKDIKHGEFNICLMSVADEPVSRAAVERFSDVIEQFADLYSYHYNRLNENVKALQDISSSAEIAGHLIMRFVKFHEAIYAQKFDTQAGDYATKPE